MLALTYARKNHEPDESMTVHQLKTAPIGADKPSLSEMYFLLARYRYKLDNIDKDFLDIISQIAMQGVNAKIEAVEEARSIAWSILTRNKIHG